MAWYVSARICKCASRSVRPDEEKKKKRLGLGKETYLSVFHPDGSKDVVRITNAIQRRNVTLIYVTRDIARGRG
jgi:hypothetical protein